MQSVTFAVLGAGSWGTAIAIHLARAGHQVRVWGNEPDVLAQIQERQMNERYLPGVLCPPTLKAVDSLAACVAGVDEICVAVPSHAFHEILQQLTPRPQRLWWLTKGMDAKTGLLLSELVAQKWGADFPCAMLAGPSFALEVAKGLPAAVTLASQHTDYQQQLFSYFPQTPLRLYLSRDLIGVQLCGIVKNVLAIACGISDGMGFGANARAALMTRGLVEMRDLGLAMGAEEKTFMGLAGMGDLVLTCTDNQSRNRRFGLAVGQGQSHQEAFTQIQQVVEGFHNASQVMMLAQRHQVDMPICHAVYLVLQGERTAKQAADELLEAGRLDPYE